MVALAVTAGYTVALALLVAEIVTVGGVRMLSFPTRAAATELLGLRRKALTSVAAGLLGGQVFVFIERFLAASLGVGAVAAISYSRGIAFTPIVLGQSIAVGLYPGMLRAHTDHNTAYLRGSFVAGLRVSLLLALTCSAYVALFAPEIARLVFERGDLLGASIIEIERTLRAFSIALVGTMLLVFTARVFNALDFFRAIVWSQAAALAVYVLLAPLLRPLFGPSGLALAFGVAELVGGALAVAVASRQMELEASVIKRRVLQPLVWRAAAIVAIVALAERTLELAGGGGTGMVAGVGFLVTGATGAAALWSAPLARAGRFTGFCSASFAKAELGDPDCLDDDRVAAAHGVEQPRRRCDEKPSAVSPIEVLEVPHTTASVSNCLHRHQKPFAGCHILQPTNLEAGTLE